LSRASALWSTDGDLSIDGLVREMVREGYFSLDDIRQDARPLVASLVDGAAGAPRCSEQPTRVK